MATETNSYGFTIPDLDQGKTEPTFQVESFKGAEALSTLYLFTVSLVSATENISGVLYKRATLTIRLGSQSSQYHGVITRFEQKRKEGEFVYYETALKPLFDILSLTRQSDVFLNLPLSDSIYADPTDTVHQAHPDSTTPPTDIITPVFKNAGFDGPYTLNLRGPNLNDAATFYAPLQNADDGNYNRWSYCCQYEETCLDFLSRIFEREGVYYYFTQGADQEVLCITDNYLSPQQPEGEILYKPPAELATEPEANVIQALVCKEEMLPKRVTLFNYDYEQAGKSVLSATAFVSNDGLTENGTYRGEVRIYGDNFIPANDEGTKLAKIRAQELFCQGTTYSGFGTAVPLMPGMLIKLIHPNPAFSGTYLVRDVHHQGAQKLALVGAQGTEGEDFFYANTFTLIPNDNTNAALGVVQFRPERKTTKPRITGTMNAFIHGDISDKYAELDQFGRYLVDLPFAASTDNTGQAVMKKSAWLRMATPYAGSGGAYGMHFPLHVGAEVILSFRDGDPDLPIIAGAAFNSRSTNPVNSDPKTDNAYSPKNLVIESAGGNKIVMNDTEGEESILIHSPYPDDKGSNMYIGKNEEGEPAFSFKASGNKYEVIVGQENDLVLGSLNIGVVGSLFEGVLGMANELHIATSTNASLGGTTELKVGPVFEYKKSNKAEIAEKSSLLGHEEVQIAAGSDPITKSLIQKVATITAGVCAAAGAIMGVAAGEVAGALDPEGKHPVREGVVAETCIALGVGLQIAALAILQKLSTEMANPASKLILGGDGITMFTLPAALGGIQIGVKKGPQYDPGITIIPTGAGSIGLKAGTLSITLENDQSITIEKTGQGKITVNSAGVTMEYGNNTAGAGKIEVSSNNVYIAQQGGGAEVRVFDELRLAKGLSGFTTSQDNLNLFGKTIALNGVFTVDNMGMVKIGGAAVATIPPPP
ncbi:MAG: type VI secretion system tip protein VgrG, partial [Syntrophales bacterium]|nr:type VI secretion system tip protein VgrG [Syntrophales bacterium]